MENRFTSFVISYIANLAFQVNGYLKYGKEALRFKERSEQFNTQISPYVITRILKPYHDDIYKKLIHTDQMGDKLYLPLIDIEIAGTESGKIHGISKNKAKIQHNEIFLNWLRDDLKKKIYNGSTYTVESIMSDGSVTIGIGDYFSTLSTSDINYFNLIKFFPLKNSAIARFLYARKQSTADWINALRNISINNNFNEQTASIGCSVLTVLKCLDGNYKFLIKKNSTAKGSAGSDRHVIPSFMFGPVSSELEEQISELDIKLHITKEYGEELLGIPECDNYASIDTLLGTINKDPLLKELWNNNSDNIELIRTGFVLDIFRLRPEFTFTLIIHDPRFAASIKTNWETESRSLEQINIENTDRINSLLNYTVSGLCPPALAAVLKGIPIAREVVRRHRQEQLLRENTAQRTSGVVADAALPHPRPIQPKVGKKFA